MSESRAEPSPESLLEELRKVRVGDMLLQTVSMLASLAYGKLAPETRDLDDARLAIDALRVLAPLVPEEARGSVQQAVSNLQLAFADAAKTTG